MANKIIDSMTYGSDTYTISTPYGTCPTGASTAAKVVTCDNFVALETGAKVTVHFTYANSVANPTLNVNGKGAKYILYRNSKLDNSAEYWKANDIITFVYDAAWSSNTGAWRLEGHLDTDTNTNTTYTVSTGDNNGQIKVAPSGGTAYNVSVKGLGSSAFVTNYKAAECTTFTSDEGNCTPAAVNKAITQGIFPAKSDAYGTIKVSSVNSSAVTVNSESSTAGRYYPVELNSDGKAIVNVPWTDTDNDTTYNAGVGLTLIATTFKTKLRSETALTVDSSAATTTSGRVYPVAVDKSGYLSVNVPWTDTNTHDGNDNQKVSAGSTTFGVNDTVKFVAGSNVTITPNATNKTITISSTDTNTDTNTWRKVQLNGTDKLGTGTNTNPLNIKAGSNMTITESGGTFTFSATDTNTNTSHDHSAGVGLVGSGSAGTGSGTYTYKAKLRSETALTVDSAAATTTSGRVYPVAVDKSGYLAVNVPWTDTDTDTWRPLGTGATDAAAGNHSHSLSLSTSSATNQVTLAHGTKYILTAGGQSLVFTMPSYSDTNTTYAIATGDSNGQIKVTPSSGSAYNVNVKGLGSAAYKDTSYFATAGHSHSSVNGYTISVLSQSSWTSTDKDANTIYFII